jgi:acyl-CoA reductase-like NAD-dependent aldehyde dehydrogenase
MHAFPVGDPADPKTAVGPWCRRSSTIACNPTSARHRRRRRSAGRGEGHPKGLEEGYFAKPTVFVNVSNDMTIAREEIFGPVLSVITYDTDVDAIRIANDSKYGLHGAVLGTDLGRARRVASQVRAGRVVINGMTDDLQAPGAGSNSRGWPASTAPTASARFLRRARSLKWCASTRQSSTMKLNKHTAISPARPPIGLLSANSTAPGYSQTRGSM